MAQDIGTAYSRQRAFLGPHPPASAAHTDHIKNKFLDVPYASLSSAHRLDIYLPDEGDGPFPVIISIHAPHSPESVLLGEQITKIPDRVQAANPETYITPATPPFFLQHGTTDTIIPVKCSINLVARLAQVAGSDAVQLELLEGADHIDPQFETADNVQKVLDFLDQHLRRP